MCFPKHLEWSGFLQSQELRDGFASIVRPKFLKKLSQVHMDGAGRYVEAFSDAFVGKSLEKQSDNLLLAGTQRAS